MFKKLKLFSTYYQCPTCWMEFEDTKSRYLPQYFDTVFERKCDFCEKNPSSLEVIKRQIDMLPDLQYNDISNLGYFIQSLAKHIDLKK